MRKQSSKKNLSKMSLLLSGIFLINLTLTPLKASSDATLPNLEPQPSGTVNLDTREQGELAKFIKQCTLDKKNLTSYEKAYNICAEKHEISPAWWQTMPGVVGIAFSTLVLGYVAGAAK